MIREKAQEVAKGKKTCLFAALLVGFVLASLLAARPAHAVSTFTVNNAGDQPDASIGDGTCDTTVGGLVPCTLRAAIQEANATANSGGPDIINFAIGGAGPHTISPTSELPDITQPVTIDGYTEAFGEGTNPASPNTATDGTTNAVLKIVLNGGNMPAGIEGNGFTIRGGGTTIRGLVINGFKQEDVADFDGNGIFMPNLAANTNNVIEGNFIGTNATGTQDLGNEESGVLAFNQSTGHRIGGPDPEDRNLISGNGRDGVGADSSENTVQGNLIGTDRGGTGDLGNGGNGVEVAGSGNLITGNIIAFNGKDGFSDAVVVFFSGSIGNSILGNSIFSNTGLGIDLNNDAPTANDTSDPDTGPNNLQNFPVITSASTTTIKGTLNSTPNATFNIQVFSSPQADASNFGEGQQLIGEQTITTSANTVIRKKKKKKKKKKTIFIPGGNASFEVVPSPAVSAGQLVTATATNTTTGDTSEFSKALAVANP